MPRLSRRSLLALSSAAAVATMVAPGMVLAASGGTRRLTLQNLHTGESLTTAYWEQGCYDSDALGAVARLCRDFRTGEVHPIDCNLLDLVHALGRAVGGGKPVQLISAYRSPKSNAKLAAKSSGVAKRSLHMQGKAFDIRIPGVSARDIYKAAPWFEGRRCRALCEVELRACRYRPRSPLGRLGRFASVRVRP